MKKKSKNVHEEDERLNEEITELRRRQKETPKGFKGFLEWNSLQKEINLRLQQLKTKQKSRIIKNQTEVVKEQVKLEKAKEELQNSRKKTHVDFSSLLPEKKKLKYDDYF
jgi:hypothetical protein